MPVPPALALYRILEEGQATFWRRFGVTQSGGSRFESGHSLPRPLDLLMTFYSLGVIDDEALNHTRRLIEKRPKEE